MKADFSADVLGKLLEIKVLGLLEESFWKAYKPYFTSSMLAGLEGPCEVSKRYRDHSESHRLAYEKSRAQGASGQGYYDNAAMFCTLAFQVEQQTEHGRDVVLEDMCYQVLRRCQECKENKHDR